MALLLEQMARSIYEGREAHGLYPAQWAALRYFQRAGRRARSVKGLAAYLGVTAGPASRTAASLQRRGLTTSERAAQDRRVVYFTLTDEGAALLRDDPLLTLASSIDAMPNDKKQAFAGILEEASNNLARRRGNASRFRVDAP